MSARGGKKEPLPQIFALAGGGGGTNMLLAKKYFVED